ncbi:CBS domain-containing protein [Klebsiella pneumoniae]|jgi:CBS domain-containing protein|uniref:CBS domain-containing protein n=1 Tax=Haloactinopolyspora sp. TaxID=1966353 RepID=UPI0011107EC1|nr:CBS domain-containing protein [Haloactinopolyspora sp.]TMZ66761.1 CBS domain-containing protein [Klebsiella pneumoniae]
MTRTRTVGELMSSDVVSVPTHTTVVAAAEVMREHDVGDVIVTANGVVRGLVTDRDLVVRALGNGLDPITTAVEDVCSMDIVGVQVDTDAEDAALTMRDFAVRRLPVLDDTGHAVGMISIGDLAAAREPDSALADISEAPPNW